MISDNNGSIQSSSVFYSTSASSRSTTLPPNIGDGITNASRDKIVPPISSPKNGDYCNPNRPCCTKQDSEVFAHKAKSKFHTMKYINAPKNPFHFEYLLHHRRQLKTKLQSAVERQDAEIIKQIDFPQSTEANSVAVNVPKSSNNVSCPPKPDLIDSGDLHLSLQGIGNMALGHEIALNKDFKFKNPDVAINKESQIAVESKNKYWQKIDQALIGKRNNLNKIKNIILDLMHTMKKMLHSVIMPHNYTIKFRINRELNLRKMAKEIDMNTFDFDKYMNFVLDTLAVTCCAIRDQEIIEIRDMIEDNVPFSRQAKRIMDLMESMSLDMSNFVISQSRPRLIQNCVAYEQTQFIKYLESEYRKGRDPIKMTRNWIISHCTPERSFRDAMAHAFLEFMEKSIDDFYCPETLVLDWFRFAPIREEIYRIVILAAVVVSAYDNAITLMNSQDDSFQNFEQHEVLRLKNLRLLSTLREELNTLIRCDNIVGIRQLQDTLSNCSAKAVQIIDDYLISEQCVGLSSSQNENITKQIQSVLDEGNPFRLLYAHRIKEWFIQVVKAEEKGVLQFPPNLHVIGPFVLKPITEISHIVNYNRAVFDIVYEEIFNGNCPPPSFFPSSNKSGSSEKILLDANNPKVDVKMDEGIANLLKKLRGIKDRSMVYRRSHINPNIQPFCQFDDGAFLPTEQQPIPAPTAMSSLEQKRYDDFLLANEPTLHVDYEGIYDASMKADDPNWMLNQTSEQLIRLMERDQIIRANKLKRIKDKIQRNIMRKRVEDNLPVFEKLWREEMDHLHQEFCRLERVRENGPTLIPENITNDPKPKSTFKGACEHKSKPNVDPPKYNEKGERIIYSRNRGKSFASTGITSQKVEYDFSRFEPDNEDEDFVAEIHAYTAKRFHYY